MELITSLIIAFIITLFASFYSAMVGGGSLITIPLLIFFGLPPSVAVATNRFSVVGLDIAGIESFQHHHLVKFRRGTVLMIASLMGAVIGAFILVNISEHILKKIIGIIIFTVLGLIIFEGKIGLKEKKVKLTKNRWIGGAFIAFLLGVYAGFFGAGYATFVVLFLIMYFGMTFLQATGTEKLLSFGSSVVATVIFMLLGKVNYLWAIVLFVASVIGAYFGSEYAVKLGNVWVRRIFIVVVSIMALKLILF